MLNKPPWIARFGVVITGVALFIGVITLMVLNTHNGKLPFWPWGPIFIVILIIMMCMFYVAFEDRV